MKFNIRNWKTPADDYTHYTVEIFVRVLYSMQVELVLGKSGGNPPDLEAHCRRHQYRIELPSIHLYIQRF